MPAFHAPEEMLLAYASGALSQPLNLVVATHIELDPLSRGVVADFEELGGALVEDLEPAEMAPGALDRILNRLDGLGPEAPAAPSSASDGHDLPAALRAFVGADIEGLKWSTLLRGVQEAEIQPRGVDGTRLSLLRIAPGRAVPKHTHQGPEMTLVLEGAYQDGGEVYRRGDLQVAGENVDHQPVAEGNEPCLCLVVSNAPIRLTGPLGRLLNPFIRY